MARDILRHSKHYARSLFSSAVLLAASASALANPPTVSPQPSLNFTSLSAAERRELAELPPASEAQQKLFAYLKTKVGHTVYRPDPPTSAGYTGQWFFARQPASHDPQIVYSVIYENLLVAKKLLRSPSLSDRQQGLVVARCSNLWLRQSLNDVLLSPRLMEAFLLPNLASAFPESWRTVSRREILEDANDAYQSVHDFPHQALVLKFLIHYGSDGNTTRWARMQLGEALAAQGRYDEAAEVVEAITAPNMMGGKALAVGWRKQADARAKEQASQPVHDDPMAHAPLAPRK